jgi:hypothetical protein
MAQPRKFPQFPLAETLTGNELVLLWQGLGNRRITLDTLKAFMGEGGGTGLSQDIIDALEGANTPSGSNVFATMADVGSGGGFTDVGAGLSIDGDGKIKFGDANSIDFTPRTSTNFDADLDIKGKFQGYYEDPADDDYSTFYYFNDSHVEFQVTAPKTNVLDRIQLFDTEGEKVIHVYISIDANTLRFSGITQFADATNSKIELLASARISSVDYEQKILIGYNAGVWGMIVRDTTPSPKGLENAGDYEANFTARSLVTKQWVENDFYPEGFILTTNTVVFNRDNVSGITTARTGDVLVDLTNAKVYGTFTMIHNDAAAFGFFLPDGVTPFVFYQSNPDDYVAGEDNILDFQFIGDGKVRLTISQAD